MFSPENVSGVSHSKLSRELWVVIRCSVWFIMVNRVLLTALALASLDQISIYLVGLHAIFFKNLHCDILFFCSYISI